MKKVTVDISKKYDIIIEYGALNKAGEYIKNAVGGDVAVIVTDDVVDKLYSKALETSLINSGYQIKKFVFPNGEISKNTTTYIELLNFMAVNKITRSDVVCALGGGVVGDLSGFAAATYLRGISYVQIPTTLLSAVDSSVGGKTAVDLDCGKNLVGAFYQPNLVLCDYSTLSTLSEDIFRDGCAEIIKYGVIADKDLFNKLKNVMSLDMTKSQNDELEQIIERCVSIKRDVVTEDEKDNGLRQILNFGHTIGHAVENCSNYTISHGSAVAIGMIAIANICANMNICKRECADEIINIVKDYGFQSEITYSNEDLFNVITSDKKRKGASISLIVSTEIGTCEIKKVPIEEVLAMLSLM